MRKKCTGRVISVVPYEKLVHVKNAFIITKKFFCLEKNLALILVISIKNGSFKANQILYDKDAAMTKLPTYIS